MKRKSTSRNTLKHPKFSSKILLIQTRNDSEIADFVSSESQAMEQFTTACNLGRVPAWIYDLENDHIIASANRAGHVLTESMINDRKSGPIKLQ